MYGQGNFPLQRPMPPYQQQQHATGRPPPPPHLQQGRPLPPLGPPHTVPRYPSTFPHAPPSQSYVHPPLTVYGGAPPQHAYQNPRLVPPPPPTLGPSRVPPPPPPSHGHAVYGPPVPQPPPSSQQGIHPMPLPPQPRPPPLPPTMVDPQPPPLPPSSPLMPPPPPPPPPTQLGSGPSSDQVPMSESTDNTATHSHATLRPSVELDMPPAPPKPADEKIVRNVEVLCQFISKNGPEFEEMARQKEYGNPYFNFLFGGEPGSEASCAREYYLWMKKKCGLVDVKPSAQPTSLINVGTSHSPADSDVDMEDDFTQSDKELGVYKSVEELNPEPLSTGDMLEIQKQENAPQCSRDSSPALNLTPPVKSLDVETKPEKTSVRPTEINSPFRLIQDYASDDNSEDDDEPCFEEVKAVKVSPPHNSGPPSSHQDIAYVDMDSNNGMKSEVGLAKDLDSSQAFQSGVNETLTNSSSPGKYEVDGKVSGVDVVATCKEMEKENEKSASSSLKVDEFGRLVKEDASESESDDSHHTKRRGRRDRSRSRSRSPSDRRRRSPRRSPRRRKDRRSPSRSWSPKRHRSRSRSPYRPGGYSGSKNMRRDKIQTPECFDFLKGRCYRGASCRYLHHDSDKSESSRRYKSKQHQLDTMVSSRNSDIHVGNITSRLPQENYEVKRENKHDVGDEKSGEEFISDAVQSSVPHQDVETLVTDVQKCQGPKEGDAQVQGEEDKATCHLPSGEENLTSGMASMNERVIHHPQAEVSIQAHDRLDEPHKQDGSTKSDFIPDFSPQISHLPPPPLPLQATNTSQASKTQVVSNSMASSVSFPPQAAQVESTTPYQAQVSNQQQSNYSVPLNPAWSVLPPQQPRPPYIVDASLRSAPLQFPHGNLPLRNDFPSQAYHMHPSNLPSHPFGGPNLIQDDRYSQFASQGLLASTSFVPGNMPPQPVPFAYSPQISAVDSKSSHPGGPVPGYSSNPMDRDNPSNFSDVGGSRISGHYNPYASTFDQPLSSRFSSSAFNLGHAPLEGQIGDGHQSRKITLSPNSSRAGGQALPRSGGDQYDPLFDSIEPSSESLKKGGTKALDVEENNKQKEAMENDEYGEIGDGEVGIVENGSPSNPDEDDPIVAEGEIEIDQVKPDGKSKKSKDSRSMKLFKIAVANFVKEVLKPQWRQGNMSKEVFKTIVKKTVDKVSGAMKNHRVPKSQEKIDHYIDSSRRKLTQLVEGYVSKYKS